MKNKKWYLNKKDLATNEVFNVIITGAGISCLIVGSKGIAINLGWKSYLVALMGLFILGLQQKWEWEIINGLKEELVEVKK
jgi:hypothetical protein